MRQTRDTFLHFLSDNLGGTPPVHNVRMDLSVPSASEYQTNAVNVKFIDVCPSPQIGQTLVEIAVLAEQELDALTWVKSVFNLLSTNYQTPKLDYTNPSSPTPVGSNIYWDTNLKFRAISDHDALYYDYRCTLTLFHRVNS